MITKADYAQSISGQVRRLRSLSEQFDAAIHFFPKIASLLAQLFLVRSKNPRREPHLIGNVSPLFFIALTVLTWVARVEMFVPAPNMVLVRMREDKRVEVQNYFFRPQ